MRHCFIDIESFSPVDLTKVGLYTYAAHPETTIQLLAYAVNDGPVAQWRVFDGSKPPPRFMELVAADDVVFHAFNAPFERVMLSHIFHIHIPAEKWVCTMAYAWSLGFAGGLAEVGKQLGVAEEEAKLKDGHKLVLKFCKPAPKSHKVDQYDHANSPEEWARYEMYNKQDVVADRKIFSMLYAQYGKGPDWEREIWLLDQAINDAGLPIDTTLVDKAIHMAHQERLRLGKAFKALTGCAPGSQPQFLAWMREHVAEVDNIQASTLVEYQDIEAVALKQQLQKTSTTKWKALERAVGGDGYLRGAFQYCGAQRTRRWAGRIFQPQNLPRPDIKDTIAQAELIRLGDAQAVHAIYGNVMQALSNTLRPAVCAPNGYLLAVADLAGIEGRVLPWLAGFQAKLDRIANGSDEYVVNAATTFNVPYDQVTDDQRFIGKVQELSLGYQGWVNAFTTMAKNYGVEFGEEESKKFILAWRRRNEPICKFWAALEEGVHLAYANPGTWYRLGKLSMVHQQDDLLVRLPSGRDIVYRELLCRNGEITFMGQNSYTRKWERLHTYGGKLAENATQAVARDVLCVGMLRAAHQGLDIRLHVHDEIGCLAEEHQAARDLEDLIACMIAGANWTQGLPLKAEGWKGKRYRK